MPTTTMSWGAARGPKFSNPTVLTVVGTQTVYAQVTYVDNSTMVGSTSNYHLSVGRTAWGSAVGVYDWSTTTGGSDLVLNTQASKGEIAVTVSFYSDAALPQPVYVNNLQVPLDDFSSARTYEGLFTPRLVASRSYEEGWAVSGATRDGTVTPTVSGISNPYNGVSTVGNIRGTGTTASPWYFPAETLTTSSRNAVGGNVRTRFSQPVNAVTVTYSSNPSTYAKNANLSGSQGSGLGAFTMCV